MNVQSTVTGLLIDYRAILPWYSNTFTSQHFTPQHTFGVRRSSLILPLLFVIVLRLARPFHFETISHVRVGGVDGADSFLSVQATSLIRLTYKYSHKYASVERSPRDSAAMQFQGFSDPFHRVLNPRARRTESNCRGRDIAAGNHALPSSK